MTANRISGIHHITAIASDPQKNLDFYAGLLGLRFVKRTVNFDDPGSYHFYFGDAAGSPGTILTFFPWPDAQRGISGSGSVTATAFAVPVGSLAAWLAHLQAAGVRDLTASTRFGQAVLSLSDPDGMGVELIETPGALDLPVAGSGWPGPGPQIPDAIAIRGFHSATITVRKPGPTAEMLTTHLGMTETTPSTPRATAPTSPDAPRRRFAGSAVAAAGAPFAPGAFIDLLEQPDAPPTHLGAGVVHHIAVRAATDAQQGAFQSALRTAGFNVTPVQDRSYFRSIYYRERAGILFEIATDAPGFAIDESPASLGMGLMLPPRYESAREQIRAHVLPVRIPTPAHPALGTHVHRWIPHPDAKPQSTQTLLLLHGTGGDENDLLSLGRKVAPAASLLSPRGNVLEGMAGGGQAPRFFRRIREGVFDMADLARRTAELRQWLAAASGAYGLTPSALTAVGFSNGANTAGAMLLTQPDGQANGQPSTPPFTRAVLLRAMTTVRPDRLPNLKGVQVLLISGKDDPIVPLADANTLAGQLRAAGADVQHEVLPAGHNLTSDDLTLTRAFLQQPTPTLPPTPALPPSPQPALSR